jgi:N-acetylneuraminic acid mutarotase
MKKEFSGLLVMGILVMFVLAACSGGGGGGGGSSLSSAKAITAFSFTSPAATGTIDENAKTIAVTVPFGTDVTALIATFTTTGAGVKVGSAAQASGTTPNDFTSPVGYLITAADSTTATFTVTVTVAPSSAKAITAFSFTSPAATGTIDENAKTIAVTVPFGTNVTALIATFTTTGAGVKVGSAEQVSGTTPDDFTSPVGYIITAADSTTATYTVTVTVRQMIWTWVSGATTTNQAGAYGTKGVASSSNLPGARNASVSWIDGSGNLWLFGGGGSDSTGAKGDLNDLWKFDGSNWTWVSGATTTNQAGAYGTKGVASSSNVPGARNSSVSWIDSGGNLWLFGGGGYDSTDVKGDLNDLWKFDGSNWTWVSGATTTNQAGAYGTKGVASSSNMPGARRYSVSWIDSSGNLWLFGGYGYDSAGSTDALNDLWKFDGSNWTWVSGANTIDQHGAYGTKGVASSSNVPGARGDSVSWIDRSGNLWLFGGYGYDSAGSWDALNDLWKFDGSNWTWVNGANIIDQNGAYGPKGVASPSNVPGARGDSVSWIDRSGNLWLFGGYGSDSTGAKGDLNDLWKFDGSNWTWVSGANTRNQNGAYGPKGVASPSNVPGARAGSASWIDSGGNLWLLGGWGHDSAGAVGLLNDLWRCW